ncbi:M48 family metalloprotease [Actinoplanes solisilvae]|uniref:M48 family metalloprotease n=1 Tax=Actinoplanes solisilvae TaxID=2486853 RepID=UPI000FD73538|nr:M48 family metalloprotease [Actinoplanes solisilvae]
MGPEGRPRSLRWLYGRLDVPEAAARFAGLCREHGLEREPRLWVAGPAVRYAFTTALPGGATTVVVPARLALGPEERFDAVVTHELAHVLARDVTWVSALRGPVWLLPPAFVLAIVPLVGRVGFSPRVITAAAGVMLLAVVIALLAAALLRLRERGGNLRPLGRRGCQTVVTVYMSAIGEPLDEELLRQVATGTERTLLSLR